jgi:hypothetical protein
VETSQKHLAIGVESVQDAVSQQMIANIDTAEARKIDGLRRAIGEPMVGHIRLQKRVDRLTGRGQITVSIPWVLYCLEHTIEKIVNYGLAV